MKIYRRAGKLKDYLEKRYNSDYAILNRKPASRKQSVSETLYDVFRYVDLTTTRRVLVYGEIRIMTIK